MTAIHIQAADGTDFYRQVATFAYASSIRQGFGAVIVTEGEFRTYGDGRVEAKVVYVPYSLDVDLPSEVITLIWDYDPERECVFAMVDGTGKATCITLTARQMGATPKRPFEEAITAQQHVPILPGTVVRVTDWTESIDPGLYVFLGEQRSEMALSVVGGDGDGTIVATDEIHRVHMDYRDAREVTGIRIELAGEC